ncbi:Lipoprotein-releasing system ATP-binding protein LolD [Hartmannibacter diazotrophicus]|uniref:Lipoprotein-releasing system ATP-binding protein LolD n=1 Tax=Hartmannibacter diazotrophicus TaxID=1482074 RepID=A0A2C9DEB9_9HYPH|nr:ABC transporter ATP-binding protein [Hartmannibacter diazotrophicus]SON58331.1 Lipoprotein-releasing system ATP-binding protein LolD [Hartmannibacter diazotrophicus]
MSEDDSRCVIRAEHIVRTLPGAVPVPLVRDVSLSVDRGEFVMIQGPSGSGKSSLLYLLGLLDVPTSGKIFLDGVDTSSLDEEELAQVRLEKLGFVFQFHFLLAEFSSLQNVMLPMERLGRLSPGQIRQRAEVLLDDLGLGDQMHKRPDQLSGGQRQRVAIARAMANEPLIILADEPTGNLDRASSANVQEILSKVVRERQTTVLAVTHDPHFAIAGDRTIHIVDGRIEVPAPDVRSSAG